MSEIFLALTHLEPVSRKQVLDGAHAILADYHAETIDTHNTSSAIMIFSLTSGKYALKIEFGSQTATQKEINWYKSLRTGNTATPVFLGGYEGEKYSFLLLQYIESAINLDDLANEKTGKELIDYIHQAWKYNQLIFDAGEKVKLNTENADKFFIYKYQKRRTEASSFPYLESLYRQKSFLINDRVLLSPDHYVERILADTVLASYLTPEIGGKIHGDLHCGNILISQSRVYLIDPNGAKNIPLEYDCGKILHSIHGYYGQIMRGDYTLLKSRPREYNFSIREPQIFRECLNSFKESLSDQQFLRGMYAEAMHFATMLPHHGSKPEETTALFIRCMQIFDELFNRLGVPA